MKHLVTVVMKLENLELEGISEFICLVFPKLGLSEYRGPQRLNNKYKTYKVTSSSGTETQVPITYFKIIPTT